jgi:hypothetical protein
MSWRLESMTACFVMAELTGRSAALEGTRMDRLSSGRAPVQAGSAVVGTSESGRPIAVQFCPSKNPLIRVLVLAGQHGDERYAIKAAGRLLADGVGLERADLAVIANANPDGVEAKRRANERGIDLNRDHVLLRASETRALHRFVREWAPDVLIDAHNYPSRRRFLIERNLVRSADICVDIPTHPALWTGWSHDCLQSLILRIKGGIEPAGATCERYTLLKDNGSARPSTFGIDDARNGIALRYASFGVLIEGRAPTRVDSVAVRERLLAALTSALRMVVGWAVCNAGQIRDWRTAIGTTQVPLRARRVSTGAVRLQCADLTTGRPLLACFEPYKSGWKIRRSIPSPAAYAVPRSLATLLEVLLRHGIAMEDASGLQYMVERVRIAALNRSRVLRTEVQPGRDDLSGYRIISATGPSRAFLTVLLEAESQYALHRHADLGIPIREGQAYPVVRVLDQGDG